MKHKKTISVAFLLEKANNMLEHSKDELVNERKATAHFISDVLHETGNYRGFGYQGSEKDTSGFYGATGRVFFYVDERIKQEYNEFAEARQKSGLGW